MKPQIAFLLAFLLVVFRFVNLCHGQNNRIIMIDNFSDNYNPTMGNVSKNIIESHLAKIMNVQIEAQKDRGNCQRIDYDLRTEKSWGVIAYTFNSPINLNQYGYLTFLMKKTIKNQLLRLQFISNTKDTVFLAADDFITPNPAIADAWLRVFIPTNNITIKKSQIKQIAFVFDKTVILLNGAPSESAMYLDDFALATTETHMLVIDRFSDLLGENATGFWSGSFSQSAQTAGYYSYTPTDSGIVALTYNNNYSDFGGAFFLFKKKVLNDWDTLKIDMWAPSGNSNPGNVKIELKKNNDSRGIYRASNISTSRKTFKIPYSSFSGRADSLAEMTLVFERNVQDRASGTLFLDNAILTRRQYVSPGSFTPSFNIVQEGQIKKENDFLWADTVLVKPDNSTLQLLEMVSVFLQMPGKTDSLISKTYATGNPEYKIPLPRKVVPYTLIKVRVDLMNGDSRAISYRLLPFGLEKVLKDAISYIRSARNEIGLYRDALKLNETPIHPTSTAANGVGILAEVVAASLGYVSRNDALLRVEATLKTVLGYTLPKPYRSQLGYCYHWYLYSGWTTDTLKWEWSRELSSIDHSILMCCSLIADDFFNTQSLKSLVYELFTTTDFSAAIDGQGKKIYRLFKPDDGNPDIRTTSDLFNEYLLTLELAAIQEKLAEKLKVRQANQKILDFWNTDISTYANVDYEKTPLLTDQNSLFISHFIYQFVYFLSERYSKSATYKQCVLNSYLVDSVWFAKRGSSYFGFGAGLSTKGTGPDFYEANHPGRNDYLFYTPSIMAGYLPAVSEGHRANIREQLLKMIYEGKFVTLGGGLVVFPRRSADKNFSSWYSGDIALIDYLPMLGLSALYSPVFFGGKYSHFENLIVTGPVLPQESGNDLWIYPNPSGTKYITVKIYNSDIRELRLLNEAGQVIWQETATCDSIRIPIGKRGNLFLLQGLTKDKHVIASQKIILN